MDKAANLNFSLMKIQGSVAASSAGLYMQDIGGTVTLANDLVTGTSGSSGANVWIHQNNTATITLLTVTNGEFSTSANGIGFLIDTNQNAAINGGSITGATFNANASYALDVVANGDAGTTSTIGNGSGAPATGTLTISNCIFTNNHGVGVSFASGGGFGASNTYIRFVNNVMTGTNSHVINVVSGAHSTGGTMQVLLSGNCIGMSGATPGNCGSSPGSANSGSTLGEGIQVTQQGKTLGTVTIQNNVIRNLDNGSGGFGNRAIDVQSLGPTASGQAATVFNVVLTGNDVDSSFTGTFPQAAIYLGVDDQGSPTTMHAAVHGNTVPNKAGCEGNNCTASSGMIFYDKVTAPSTGTLFNFSGSGANVSSEIANTNTGVAGKTCAVDLVNLTLTSAAVPVVN